jgi:anaerobic selenocysteine-containing dehydrogenase
MTEASAACVGSAQQRDPARSPAALEAIPGLPPEASRRLLQLLAAEAAVRQVWLYGSRAMGRQRHGSDIDLTLVGEDLDGNMLLQLMQAIDDLLLP